MAGPGNILITVGAETAAAVRNLGNVHDALGETMTRGEKMSAGLKKAAVPAALALTAIGAAGMKAAQAAMEDAKGVDHLAGVLERTTGASKAAQQGMEDWISKTSLASGVADDQLRPALEKLATATHSVTEAQKLGNIAMDIAAATGKDVDTVSTALAKGYQGQTAAMAKLVPGLSEASRSSKDFNVILGELAKTTGGASADAADTAAGKMARFNVATSELTETLGYSLLPIIESVIPILLKMADFASQNTTAIKILVGVVALFAGGILAANVAMKAYAAAQVIVKAATAAWEAAQWLLNAALDANPIGIVVLAIAALTAGIILAYKNSQTFRDIVQAALAVVKTAVENLETAFKKLWTMAQTAFDWIAGHWKLALFAFGPIGAAIYLLATNWDKVTAAAQAAWDTVTAAAAAIAAAFTTMADSVGAAVRAATGWIDDLVAKIATAVGDVRDLIGWLGKIKVPSIPHIPSPFAAPASSRFAPSPMARSLAVPAAGGTTNIYVSGAIDPEATARQIRRILAAHDRRQGR